MRFSRSTHLPMCLSLGTLSSIIRTYSVKFGGGCTTQTPISNDLTQIVNFPTRIPDCDSHSPALLDLFISLDTSICSTMAFPPLGNFDHVVVSVSIDFPINSKQDSLFHRVAYGYSHADWDGLRDHLRDVPWEMFHL